MQLPPAPRGTAASNGRAARPPPTGPCCRCADATRTGFNFRATPLAGAGAGAWVRCLVVAFGGRKRGLSSSLGWVRAAWRSDRARLHRSESNSDSEAGGTADRVKTPGLGRLLRLPFPPPPPSRRVLSQAASARRRWQRGALGGATTAGKEEVRGPELRSGARAVAACGSDSRLPSDSKEHELELV